jgi:lysophospholipase L1-like esterase
MLRRNIVMKVICFGDSNTYGYENLTYIGGRYAADSRWVDLLAQQTGWNIINEGLNGREIPRRPIQIPDDTDFLIIMLGTNDARNAFPGTDSSAASLDGYRRNITQIIETVKKLGAADIVTTIPPTKPAAALECGVVPVWETKAFNNILREVCKQANVPLNDMEATLTSELDKVIVPFDNVHISVYGQKLMAASVYPYLVEEMTK